MPSMGAATEISEHPEAEVLVRARIPQGQVSRVKPKVVGQRPASHPTRTPLRCGAEILARFVGRARRMVSRSDFCLFIALLADKR